MASEETTSNRRPSTRHTADVSFRADDPRLLRLLMLETTRDADVLAIYHASLHAAMHTQSTVHIYRVPVKLAIIYSLAT